MSSPLASLSAEGFCESDHYLSWGRAHRFRHYVKKVHWLSDGFNFLGAKNGGGLSLLAYGAGRSYGDSCLNEGQGLIDLTSLNRLIAFDRASKTIRCEAGVTLEELLAFTVPQGFFVPVTPGTKYVTLGGAIANDVHGKNHHVAGTFGRHVVRFELARSDGKLYECSPRQNADLFRATIGGLGLTGVITWVELALLPIQSAYVDIEEIKFGNLQEFLAIEKDSASWDYTVSWVDMLATGRSLGRGIFMRGRHALDAGSLAVKKHPVKPVVPFEAPDFALGPLAMRCLAFAYYHKQLVERRSRRVHYEPYFYPLDAVTGWNKAYGRRGLSQFQCVLPLEEASSFERILRGVAESGGGSFLAVLKTFGDMPSPGMMSFPRPGLTLTLDFANRGAKTLSLLHELTDIVAEHGGRCYPAKDAAMTAKTFAQFYPEAVEFSRYVDPKFSSSFWRRVNGGEGGR